MRSDRRRTSNNSRKMLVAAICIMLIGFALSGAVLGKYYSEVNYYNSEEGIQDRAEIDKQIDALKVEQRAEWIKNDRSEKYYELEDKINSLIVEKEQKPPVRMICYAIFPIIGALTLSIPLAVMAIGNKRKTEQA